VAIRKEIQRVHSRVESPTVYVTHDQSEALSMSDRVAIMNDGDILSVDTPDNVYHYPENRFVASFIGNPSMNFVDARIESTSGGTVTVVFEGNTIDLESTGESPQSDVATVGFRPEAVTLHRDPGEGYVDGRLELVERIGDRKLATIDGPAGEIRAFADEDLNLAAGEQVGVSFPPERVHLFDGETDRAIARGGDT